MQFKPVPPAPDDLDDLRTVHEALPRVPRPERDCCADLATRVAWIEDRDAAREWLVFCRALGLASRTAGGRYVRGAGSVDAAALAERFAANVLAAAAVRDALPVASDDGSSSDDGSASASGDRSATPAPLDAPTVLERVEEVVPEWERRRGSDWRREWTVRVRRCLEWWTLLGGARTVGDGFVRIDD